jgi:glycosyltransferase involved in cell wall biosynthesis
MLTVVNISQNYYLRGGSDRMFFATTDALEKHGQRVIPFAAADARNEPTEWARYFPAASNFESPRPIDLARYIYSFPAKQSLQKLIADQKPDLAHLHIYYGKLTTAILHALKQNHIPVVQTLHEYRLLCPVSTLTSHDVICEDCKGNHFWRALPKKCNRHSLARTALSVTESYVSHWLGAARYIDRFIAVSEFLRGKMIEHGFPAERITTIHNCVDTTGITPARTPGRHLLYFGRLEKVKGIMTLIEAVAPLKHIPLMIVGDGSLRGSIEARLQRDGLDHIRLLGFRSGPELAEIIAGSICAILPSEWYETLGLTLLESFTHGRPVVASRIGGIPEVVTDQVDGFLFEPGNVDQLREKLEWMAAHPERAIEMGLAGRRKVETAFSPEKYYDELIAVYRRVLKQSA